MKPGQGALLLTRSLSRRSFVRSRLLVQVLAGGRTGVWAWLRELLPLQHHAQALRESPPGWSRFLWFWGRSWMEVW